MSLNDTLANALSAILNCEKIGKSECIITPSSSLITSVLDVMKKNGYIKDATLISSGRGGTLKVSLVGRINKCGVIKPRFSVQLGEYEKFEKRYLPGVDMGIIIVSTSSGIMTHREAKKKRIGGRLIAYCY